MTWVVLALVVALQGATLWLLWGVCRSLNLRPRIVPRLSRPATVTSPRPDFPGAIPPNRYVVVRWPQGWLEYQGCGGAAARTAYENTNPAPGEEIEFWELGDRRGHKEG